MTGLKPSLNLFGDFLEISCEGPPGGVPVNRHREAIRLRRLSSITRVPCRWGTAASSAEPAETCSSRPGSPAPARDVGGRVAEAQFRIGSMKVISVMLGPTLPPSAS